MKWLRKFLGEGPFIVGSIKSNFCIDRRRVMTGCELFLSRKNVLSVKKTCPKSTELLVQTHGIYPGISQRGGNWFQVNFESFYSVVFLPFKPCVLISLQAWKWCFKKPTETLQIVFLPTKKHYRRVVNLSRECF